MVAPVGDREKMGVWDCPRCGSSNRNETGLCSICGADSFGGIPETSPVTVKDQTQLPEDLEITKITNTLAGKLGISDYPQRMRFQDTYWIQGRTYQKMIDQPNSSDYRSVEVPVDPSYPTVVQKTMLISSLLQGRGITPEEWAPIVASPLIFQTRLKGARNRGKAWRFLLALLIPAYFLGATPLPLITAVQSAASIGITIGLVTLLILLGLSWRLFTKRLVFRADSEADRLLGPGTMLAGLNKLDSLREHDALSNVQWPIDPFRSIRKRMRHLNSQ